MPFIAPVYPKFAVQSDVEQTVYSVDKIVPMTVPVSPVTVPVTVPVEYTVPFVTPVEKTVTKTVPVTIPASEIVLDTLPIEKATILKTVSFQAIAFPGLTSGSFFLPKRLPDSSLPPVFFDRGFAEPVRKKKNLYPWFPASYEMVTFEEFQTGQKAVHVGKRQTTQDLFGRLAAFGQPIPTLKQYKSRISMRRKGKKRTRKHDFYLDFDFDPEVDFK